MKGLSRFCLAIHAPAFGYVASALLTAACGIELSGLVDGEGPQFSDSGEPDLGATVSDATAVDAVARRDAEVGSVNPPGYAGDALADTAIETPTTDVVVVPDVPTTPFCNRTSPSLVACFRFEGSVTDESSYANHPTTLGTIQFNPGKVGQAVRVNAASAISIPDHPSFNVTTLTIEMWVRPASIPATSSRAGLVDSDGRFGVFLHPGGIVQCSSGGILQSNPLAVDVWTHIACVHDGTNAFLYQNGTLVTTAAAAAIVATTATTVIGANSPSGDPFDGLLDQLRVWNVARTPAQIRETATLTTAASD